MTKKQYADAEYQRERRAKIKSGEITPHKPRRIGLVDTLANGLPWVEVFQTRKEANAFQRTVSAIAKQVGGKTRSKTYVSVDPDTDTAVFIVESRLRGD